MRYFDAAPRVRVLVGDREIAAFDPVADFDQAFTLPADLLDAPNGRVVIESSKFFVPAAPARRTSVTWRCGFIEWVLSSDRIRASRRSRPASRTSPVLDRPEIPAAPTSPRNTSASSSRAAKPSCLDAGGHRRRTVAAVRADVGPRIRLRPGPPRPAARAPARLGDGGRSLAGDAGLARREAGRHGLGHIVFQTPAELFAAPAHVRPRRLLSGAAASRRRMKRRRSLDRLLGLVGPGGVACSSGRTAPPIPASSARRAGCASTCPAPTSLANRRARKAAGRAIHPDATYDLEAMLPAFDPREFPSTHVVLEHHGPPGLRHRPGRTEVSRRRDPRA